jgi:salicyloyl-CoA 5-hydroxylase
VRIACIGGGPGGLFLSALIRRELPDSEVVVYERNRATDAFGFGVVFSNATLGAIDAADPVLRDALLAHGRHWDDIEVRVHGERLRCGGNGMAAIVRSTLLRLLQERASAEGVDLRFETEVASLDELDGYDLIVAADGANSRFREQAAGVFQPTVETASAKFIWLGTTYPYGGLTFVHEAGPDGVFAAHAYPIDDGLSTFIVETDEDTWRRAGLDAFDVDQPPGPSDERTVAYLEELFAEQLEGHRLIGNNSRWGNFRTLRTARWRHERLALLGDAAHTAHFSVGSGTKMAMEDAAVLARVIAEHPDDLDRALERYERERRPAVERVQGASVPSLSWWEHFGRYHTAMEATQFVFHFLSRSITRLKLQQRDPGFVEEVDRWWYDRHGRPPLETPLGLGPLVLPSRQLRLLERDGRSSLVAGNVEVLLRTVDGGDDPDGAALGGLRLDLAEGTDHGDLDGLVDDVVAAAGPAVLVLSGGDELARVLGSERARLEHGVPTVLVGDHDDDLAATLVLSGRADAVARPELDA